MWRLEVDIEIEYDCRRRLSRFDGGLAALNAVSRDDKSLITKFEEGPLDQEAQTIQGGWFSNSRCYIPETR